MICSSFIQFFLQAVAYTWPLPTLVHYFGKLTLFGKMVIYVHLVTNPESM